MKFGTFLNFCDLNSIAISDNDSKPQSLEYKQKKAELVVGVGSCSIHTQVLQLVCNPQYSNTRVSDTSIRIRSTIVLVLVRG